MEKNYNNSVFINCPFDDSYREIFYAIIFTVFRCGFVPRSSLEEDNGLNNRLTKIEHIIAECRFGIHDLSRTEVNTNLFPRFNMPFELGVFFGARKFGDTIQKKKVALILEKQKYSYQQFISDLNGIDTQAHSNEPLIALRIVRDWLKTTSKKESIEGHLLIAQQYNIFRNDILPAFVKLKGLEANSLTYIDYCLMIEESLDFIK